MFVAALAMCGDRQVAMDATQEAFAKAFARWSRLRNEEWAVGWVMTTALNLCRRYARKRSAPPTPMSARQSHEAEVTERLSIDEALQRLPERQRQTVILHYLEDLPVSAVAELMGLTEGGVKANLHKARANLRALRDEPASEVKRG